MGHRAVVDELLVGTARFAADLPEPGALVLAFVTSPFAHARIDAIDTSAAATTPGVVAVYTAAELPTVPIHEIALIPETFAQPALAVDEVRYVGEYVVAIVGQSAAAVADAAEL